MENMESMDTTSLLGSTADGIYEKMITENLSERKLLLNMPIGDDVLTDIIMYILKWNKEDKDIPVEKRKPIIMYIDSGGGDCFSGFNLVDVIEASETPIIGVGMSLVASMAYHIFICCHKRYAFANTTLLQHDGEISVSNSTSKVRDTMRFFDTMEKRTKQHVLKHTSMSEEFYDEHYDQEYYMYANSDGKEFNCVDKIIGEDCSLDEVI